MHEDFTDYIEYVVSAHSISEPRKGSGLPYVFHPLDVVKTLAGWGIKEQAVWRAALCHDVIEECGLVKFEIAEVIGDESADFVEELSFIPDPTSGIKPWRQKAEYMASFKTKSLESLVIKIADRVCNTWDFYEVQSDYTPKYWAKADTLFAIYDLRKAEVVARFGETVVARIDRDIAQVRAMLAV